jgi:hypothetical protein
MRDAPSAWKRAQYRPAGDPRPQKGGCRKRLTRTRGSICSRARPLQRCSPPKQIIDQHLPAGASSSPQRQMLRSKSSGVMLSSSTPTAAVVRSRSSKGRFRTFPIHMVWRRVCDWRGLLVGVIPPPNTISYPPKHRIVFQVRTLQIVDCGAWSMNDAAERESLLNCLMFRYACLPALHVVANKTLLKHSLRSLFT